MAAVDAGTEAGQAEAVLVLKAKLDLTESEALAAAFRERRGADVTVDASGVEHLGAHALQTLLVAARSWQADGHAFSVAGWSESAQEQLAALGVDGEAFASERTSS